MKNFYEPCGAELYFQSMGYFILNNMKTCTKCNVEKEFTEFGRLKASKNGYRSECKMCVKEYRLRNSEHIVEYRKQYAISNKENQKLYKLKNKEKIKEQDKQYRLNNKDRYEQWRIANKKSINDKANQYNKNKKSKDSLFKLSCNIRTLMGNCIKRQGYKKTSRTFEILGCSYEEFKQHLENQFTEGMTWNNAGEWHIDHIYPVSLAIDENHLIKLNHYTNLQPLWAIDNIRKSNKY
jgi:hypothetical protein